MKFYEKYHSLFLHVKKLNLANHRVDHRSGVNVGYEEVPSSQKEKIPKDVGQWG